MYDIDPFRARGRTLSDWRLLHWVLLGWLEDEPIGQCRKSSTQTEWIVLME